MAETHATLDVRIPSSWRVRFAYRGDDIRPVAAEHVRMIAPGGVALTREEQRDRSGAFVEVVAGGDRGMRWSRAIAQPNRADRELFLEDGGITRIDAPAEGEFELVIPDFGDDATFNLFTSPVDSPERPAKRRMRARLADFRRLESGGPTGHSPEA